MGGKQMGAVGFNTKKSRFKIQETDGGKLTLSATAFCR
jgi:hypothetical protein